MQIAQQPAVIHVAHDVLDGIEGVVDMRRVVHGEHDAGDDLRHQHEGEDAAEGPPVVQVCAASDRRRRTNGSGSRSGAAVRAIA